MMGIIDKPKVLGENAGEWNVWGNKGFGKLLPIPKNLEDHMHFQSCAHVQERPEKALKLSPVADLESL